MNRKTRVALYNLGVYEQDYGISTDKNRFVIADYIEELELSIKSLRSANVEYAKRNKAFSEQIQELETERIICYKDEHEKHMILGDEK